ncbi:transcriptional regulator [Paenibacillus cisolokensis]|uniref:Transcriptional regulator n=1 Tax=Paenibacillus cisolokensis TaxID=1658519 RepID=A0ABQ4N611_9BACL|nr:helix-turn-helix domain-containing protein [Paenibacillus cisolokensis]GIQ63591.1 transcriptional regulator [Paenibacillus cisolokensis]
MSLGRRIKELRLERKLTQQQIAEKLGMGRSNFGHIENDRVTPTAEDLQKIADILETSTDYLLGRSDLKFQTKIENPNPIPSWATYRDRLDFKKLLEEDAPVMFDGVPIDEEDKEKVLKVMEAIFWDAKKKNKRKPIDE